MKNIVVTGTSRGIGLELVILYSQANYNVLALSRNTNILKKLQLKNVTTIAFDLTEESDYKKVSEYISRKWNQVDVLINNAGALLNKPF